MWEQLNDLEVRAAAVALGCNMNQVNTKEDAIAALGAAGIEEMQAKAALVRMANSLSALTPTFMPGLHGMNLGPGGIVQDDVPKRNVSAYCWFVQRNRDRIQREGLQGEKFMTRAVKLWQELPESDRAQYEALAKDDKERYKRERRMHKIQLRKAEHDEDGGAKRRRKHPDAPKRAVPAYMLYANAERENVKAEMPTLTHREILAELGQRWRGLPEEEKSPYERQAEMDRQRYSEEIAKWREQHPEPKDDGDDRRRRRKKEEGAPKRAQTAFLFYANEMRSAARLEFPEKSHKEVLVILGDRWKNLPDDRKDPYLAQAEADRARYHEEMTAWRANNPKEEQSSTDAQQTSLTNALASQLFLPMTGTNAQNAAVQSMAMALMGHMGSLPKKRGRKKKEPGAPKKCSTAFLFYANAFRSQAKEENPELKHSDVLKVLGEQWRHLSEEEKEPYEEQAREDRIRYDKEMEEWRSQKAAEPPAQVQAPMPYNNLSIDPTQAAAQAAALSLTLNPSSSGNGAAAANNAAMQGYNYLPIPQVPNSMADLTSAIAGSLNVGANSFGLDFTSQEGV